LVSRVEVLCTILGSTNHCHCACYFLLPRFGITGAAYRFSDRLQRDAPGGVVVLCQETRIELVGMSSARNGETFRLGAGPQLRRLAFAKKH